MKGEEPDLDPGFLNLFLNLLFAVGRAGIRAARRYQCCQDNEGKYFLHGDGVDIEQN